MIKNRIKDIKLSLWISSKKTERLRNVKDKYKLENYTQHAVKS